MQCPQKSRDSKSGHLYHGLMVEYRIMVTGEIRKAQALRGQARLVLPFSLFLPRSASPAFFRCSAFSWSPHKLRGVHCRAYLKS